MKLNDNYYMSLAIMEAEKGAGLTNPNPAVGAVIVKNNKIISKGYHKKCGDFHAERNAVINAGDISLEGASIYSTLQPCCHYGKTPPCTEIIIESGIKNVIYGSSDPDERVKDKSDSILLNAGLNVKSGVLKKECDSLNNIYFFNKYYKRPLIILKAALTLDGRITSVTNNSKWISNEESRNIVQILRSKVSGIVIGGNTFRTDSPRLNCRLPGYEHKVLKKIIFSDSPFDIDAVFISKKQSENPSYIYEVCEKNSIDSLIVEGGSEVYSYFIKNKLSDQIVLFYKPSFLGNGKAVFNDQSITQISDLDEYEITSSKIINNNLMLVMQRRNLKFLPEL